MNKFDGIQTKYGFISQENIPHVIEEPALSRCIKSGVFYSVFILAILVILSNVRSQNATTQTQKNIIGTNLWEIQHRKKVPEIVVGRRLTIGGAVQSVLVVDAKASIYKFAAQPTIDFKGDLAISELILLADTDQIFAESDSGRGFFIDLYDQNGKKKWGYSGILKQAETRIPIHAEVVEPGESWLERRPDEKLLFNNNMMAIKIRADGNDTYTQY